MERACVKKRSDDPAHPRSILKSDANHKNDRPLHSVHLQVQHKSPKPSQSQWPAQKTSETTPSPLSVVLPCVCHAGHLNYNNPNRCHDHHPFRSTPETAAASTCRAHAVFHPIDTTLGHRSQTNESPRNSFESKEPDPLPAVVAEPPSEVINQQIEVLSASHTRAPTPASAGSPPQEEQGSLPTSSFDQPPVGDDLFPPDTFIDIPKDRQLSKDALAIVDEIKSLRQRELLESEFRQMLEQENQLQQWMLENLRLQEKQLHVKESIPPSILPKLFCTKSPVRLRKIPAVDPTLAKEKAAPQKKESIAIQTEPKRKRSFVRKRRPCNPTSKTKGRTNNSSSHDLTRRPKSVFVDKKHDPPSKLPKSTRSRRASSTSTPRAQSKRELRQTAKTKLPRVRRKDPASSVSLVSQKRPPTQRAGTQRQNVNKLKTKRSCSHQGSSSTLIKVFKKRDSQKPAGPYNSTGKIKDRRSSRLSAVCHSNNERCSKTKGPQLGTRRVRKRRPTSPKTKCKCGNDQAPRRADKNKNSDDPLIADHGSFLHLPKLLPVNRCNANKKILKTCKDCPGSQNRPRRSGRRGAKSVSDQGFFVGRASAQIRFGRVRRAAQPDNTSIDLKNFRREVEVAERTSRRWSEEVRSEIMPFGYLPTIEQNDPERRFTNSLTYGTKQRASLSSVDHTSSVALAESSSLKEKPPPILDPERPPGRSKGLLRIRKLIFSRSKKTKKKNGVDAKSYPVVASPPKGRASLTSSLGKQAVSATPSVFTRTSSKASGKINRTTTIKNGTNLVQKVTARKKPSEAISSIVSRSNNTSISRNNNAKCRPNTKTKKLSVRADPVHQEKLISRPSRRFKPYDNAFGSNRKSKSKMSFARLSGAKLTESSTRTRSDRKLTDSKENFQGNEKKLVMKARTSSTTFRSQKRPIHITDKRSADRARTSRPAERQDSTNSGFSKTKKSVADTKRRTEFSKTITRPSVLRNEDPGGSKDGKGKKEKLTVGLEKNPLIRSKQLSLRKTASVTKASSINKKSSLFEHEKDCPFIFAKAEMAKRKLRRGKSEAKTVIHQPLTMGTRRRLWLKKRSREDDARISHPFSEFDVARPDTGRRRSSCTRVVSETARSEGGIVRTKTPRAKATPAASALFFGGTVGAGRKPGRRKVTTAPQKRPAFASPKSRSRLSSGIQTEQRRVSFLAPLFQQRINVD